MKKTLLSALLLLTLLLPAHAQVMVGFRGGFNVTEMSFSEKVFNSSNRLGFVVGPTVKIGLPLSFLAIDVAALYEEKTAKINGESIKQENIIVPANIRLIAGKGAGLYLAAGPQLAFNVGDDEFSWSKDGISNTFQLGFVYNIGVSKTGDASWGEARDAVFKSDDTKAKGWSVQAAYYF